MSKATKRKPRGRKPTYLQFVAITARLMNLLSGEGHDGSEPAVRECLSCQAVREAKRMLVAAKFRGALS